MAGVTSIDVKESLDDLAEKLRHVETPTNKERLQVLYWLKQDNAPSISAIAKAVGKHRNTVQTWLSNYREGGVKAMLEVKKSPGGKSHSSVGRNGFSKAATGESRIPELWSGTTMVSRNAGGRSGVSRGLPNDALPTQSKTEGRSSSKLPAR